MPQGRKTGQAWLPYLYLTLIPLSLLGLDSYGWLFTREAKPTQPFGLWPRQIPAQTPRSFSLQLPDPEQAPDSLRIERSGWQQRLAARITQAGWQVELPPLAPGQYRLHLMRQGQALGEPASLSVRPAPSWQLRSDRPAYLPGDWLMITTRLLSPLPGLRVEVLGPDGARLHARALSAQSGLSSERLRLPAQLSPGVGQILLYARTGLLARRSFRILPATPAQTGLQLIGSRDQRLSGIEQPLGLRLLDSAGQPVEEGWIRLLGQTLAVKAGQASLQLPAQAPERIGFTAGDSRGNLLQGELALEQIAGDWLAQASAGAGLEILVRREVSLSWVLGQGQQSLAQGQSQLRAGWQRLDLPQTDSDGPRWIKLCDQRGQCQQLRWLPEARPAEWPLQPARPHALQPLRVTPPSLPAGQLETWRSQQLGYEVLSYGQASADGLLQQIGAPAPHQERPWPLSLWTLAGLGLSALPLTWLRRLRSKPFPDAARRARSTRGQQSLLIGGGLALACLVLSWFQLVPAAAGAAVAGLALALANGVLMRPLLNREHPLTPWIPALQSVLLLLLGWFCLTYQPGLLGAVLLAWGLLCLVWSELWQRLVPVSRLQPLRTLLLAALVVGAGGHALIQLNPAHLQPEPGRQPAQRSRVLSSRSLVPRGRLLQHQLLPGTGPQILPASRRSGSQRLSWRLWASDGHIESWSQALQVQPAVLAEAQLPAYALAGDRLTLPIRLLNETGTAQPSGWRLGRAGAEVQLAPRSSQVAFHELSLGRPGWQQLSLEHRFKDSWYAQPLQVFVQAKPAPVADPRLHLELSLPESQGLVPGQEIPVLVRLRQSSGRSLSLGLRIGLPGGFSPLTDTLDDSAHRDWLAHWRPAPGSLELSTLPLPSGQDVSFHFRLRAELPGSFQMPPPRLFQLDQPKLETILPVPAVLEVQNKTP